MSQEKYLMKSGEGETAMFEFLELSAAGKLYDCGFIPVTLGEYVLCEDNKTVRLMNDQDKAAISNSADRYSESK